MKACLIQLAVFATLAGMVGTSIWLSGKELEAMTPFEAWLSDMGVAIIGGTIIGLVVVGAVLSGLRKAARAKAAWQAFADEYGLTVAHGVKPALSGTVRGRALQGESWSTAGRSSNGIGPTREHQGDGAVFQRLSLELRGAPAGVQAFAGRDRDALGKLGTILLAAAQQMVGAEPPPPADTGDPAFDEAVVLHQIDDDDARAWLTPTRRAALRELVEDGGRIADGRVSHVQQGRSEKASELIERLTWLESIVDRLDGGGP